MPNPLALESPEDILARYTPEELAVYRARGMLMSNGVPTIPPGVALINSKGMPYSRTLLTMSPQEKRNAILSDKNLRQGKGWDNLENADAQANGGVRNIPVERAMEIVKGPESGGNYNIGFGNVDLSNAPRDEYGFPIWQGKVGSAGLSHAAGAYQFQPGTWRKYAAKLGVRDFSPESQDKVFKAAYEAEGFGPWAPYNSVIAKKLGSNLELVGNNAGVNSGNRLANLVGQIDKNPLELPNDEIKSRIADALMQKPQSSMKDILPSIILLSLMKSFKITPVDYDPWKYVGKV